MNYLGPDDVFRGQKVGLRPPRIEDLSFIHSLWTDPETMEAVGGIVDYSEEKLRHWFGRMVDPGGRRDCYCLILNKYAKPIGEVSFHHFNSEDRSARLNIKVQARSRGHGYGKDALATFLAFFFRKVGGQVMTDNVGIKNRLAQRLLLFSGFERDDSYTDVCMMIMTREIYLARYKYPNNPLETIPDGCLSSETFASKPLHEKEQKRNSNRFGGLALEAIKQDEDPQCGSP